MCMGVQPLETCSYRQPLGSHQTLMLGIELWSQYTFINGHLSSSWFCHFNCGRYRQHLYLKEFAKSGYIMRVKVLSILFFL